MKSILSSFFILAFSIFIFSQEKNVNVANVQAEKATNTLKTFFEFDANSVPYKIFKKAKAVLVFNDITQINLVLNKGSKGKGLFLALDGENWSVPTFVEFNNMGFEFKIADKKKFDLIFFVMDDALLKTLKIGSIGQWGLAKYKLALGPIIEGRGAENVLESASLIYYPFEKGKLSGIEVQNDFVFNAVGIKHNDKLNKAIYKKEAHKIFSDKSENLKMPEAINNVRQIILDNIKNSN